MTSMEKPNFEIARRGGYEPAAVDAYINRLLVQLESLEIKSSKLEEELSKRPLEASPSVSDELLKIIEEAKSLSQVIEAQANNRAAEIIEEATKRAEVEYQHRVSELEASIIGLVSLEASMKNRKDYIEGQLSQIKEVTKDSLMELGNRMHNLASDIGGDFFDVESIDLTQFAPKIERPSEETQANSSVSFEDVFSSLGISFDN